MNDEKHLAPEVVEKVVIGGDLAGLDAAQRAEYYGAVCRSLGLNPLTKPFEYLTLNGKLRLYALRDCADQLRRLHGISIYIAGRDRMNDVYIVTARAKDRTGREDESTGVVNIGDFRGDALANALMKAETKAKRRVTLSIAGLGWLDETELDTIPTYARSNAPLAEMDGFGEKLNRQDIDELWHEALSIVTLQEFSARVREVLPKLGEQEVTKAWLLEHLTSVEQFKTLADPYIQPPPSEHPTVDQINSLVQLSKDCDVDPVAFGKHMRHLMDLDEETKITKKFLREAMTLAQFEEACQHYTAQLKKIIEQEAGVDDVPDYPPSDAPLEPMEQTATITAETPVESPPDARSSNGEGEDSSDTGTSPGEPETVVYATSQQISALKRLAQQVDDDAYADVQDAINARTDGMPLAMYEDLKALLEKKKVQSR